MSNLEQLADQYEQSADLVMARIHERNEKLKKLDPRCNEALILKREIKVLYDERLEAIKTARRLKDYYEMRYPHEQLH